LVAPFVPSLPSATITGFFSIEGVPTLETSSSSSITKAASNSAGSGPRPVGAVPSSFGFARLGLAEGESVREEDLRADEPDRDTAGGVDDVVAEAFWRACSSAIR